MAIVVYTNDVSAIKTREIYCRLACRIVTVARQREVQFWNRAKTLARMAIVKVFLIGKVFLVAMVRSKLTQMYRLKVRHWGRINSKSMSN